MTGVELMLGPRFSRGADRLVEIEPLLDTGSVVESTPRNLELETAAFANLGDLDSWRVYADWLLSKGDVRGEIANLTVHIGDSFASERKRTQARIHALERPFIDAWHVWAQTRDLLGVEVGFKRGFAHSIVGPLSQLAPVIDELFERDPIQRLSLTEVEPEAVERLCGRDPAWFERLRYLKIAGQLDSSSVAALASVELTALHRFNAIATGIDDRACGALANLRTQNLEHLTLTANSIGDAGLAALLRSPMRGRWRELFLSGNPIERGGLVSLANAKGLDSLEGLYLRNIDAAFADFVVFRNPKVLPTLKVLELSGAGAWQQEALRGRLQERFGAGLLMR